MWSLFVPICTLRFADLLIAQCSDLFCGDDRRWRGIKLYCHVCVVHLCTSNRTTPKSTPSNCARDQEAECSHSPDFVCHSCFGTVLMVRCECALTLHYWCLFVRTVPVFLFCSWYLILLPSPSISEVHDVYILCIFISLKELLWYLHRTTTQRILCLKFLLNLILSARDNYIWMGFDHSCNSWQMVFLVLREASPSCTFLLNNSLDIRMSQNRFN